MLRWRICLALAGALVAAPVMPSAVGAAAPSSPTVLGRSTAAAFAVRPTPRCGSQPAPAGPVPAEPVAAEPWAQRRYAPDRLAPLATGAGVTVAVIDSGVDTRHPQLRGRIAEGADYLDPGGDGTVDCAEHGTAVASIIVAGRRAGVGFRGFAPQARILPVRVSEQLVIDGRESGRTVSPAQFSRAIRWAVDHGADVLNLSVVLYEDSPAVRSAVAYAQDRDVVVVAAVGNLHAEGDPIPYPAAYAGVLGVGAIGPDGARSQFSQVGSYVDVLAPGSDVLAAVPGGGHRTYAGTSLAVPFVSATAALVRDYRPDLRATQVVERILATADPAPEGQPGDAYGAGVANPYRAVSATSPVGDASPAATPNALPAPRPDPATLARRDRRSQTRAMSVRVAVSGAGLAGVVVLAAMILPRARRRRWRPAFTPPAKRARADTFRAR